MSLNRTVLSRPGTKGPGLEDDIKARKEKEKKERQAKSQATLDWFNQNPNPNWPKNFDKYQPRSGNTKPTYNPKNSRLSIPGATNFNLDEKDPKTGEPMYSPKEIENYNGYPIYEINGKWVVADTDFNKSYGFPSQRHTNRGDVVVEYYDPSKRAEAHLKYGGHTKQKIVNNLQENSVYLNNRPVMNRKLRVAEEGMAAPQEGAMPPQEQAQQGAPQQGGGELEQVMQMIQQASEQGGQPQDVIAGLLEQQIAPEIIAQALVQLGMPQEQAVQMIEQVAQGGGQEQQGQEGPPEMAAPQGEMGAPEGAPQGAPPMMNEGGIATNVFGLLNSANMKDFASMKKKLLKQYKTGGTADFTAEDMSSTEAMSTAMKNMMKSHMFKSYASNAVGKGKANQQKMFDAIPTAENGILIGEDGIPTWDGEELTQAVKDEYGVETLEDLKNNPDVGIYWTSVVDKMKKGIFEDSEYGKRAMQMGYTYDDISNPNANPSVKVAMNQDMKSYTDSVAIDNMKMATKPAQTIEPNRSDIELAPLTTPVVTAGEETTAENSKDADSGDTKVVTEGPKKGATQTFDGEKWVTDVPDGPKKGDIQVWDGEKYVTKNADDAGGDASQGQANVNRVKPGLYADNTSTGRGRGIRRNGVGNFLQDMSQIVTKNQIGVQGNMSPEEFAKYSKNNSIAGIDYKRGLFGKEKFSIRFNPNTGQKELADPEGNVVDPSTVDPNDLAAAEAAEKEVVTAVDVNGESVEVTKEEADAEGLEVVSNTGADSQNTNGARQFDNIDDKGALLSPRERTQKGYKGQKGDERRARRAIRKDPNANPYNKQKPVVGINGEVLDVNGTGPEVQPLGETLLSPSAQAMAPMPGQEAPVDLSRFPMPNKPIGGNNVSTFPKTLEAPDASYPNEEVARIKPERFSRKDRKEFSKNPTGIQSENSVGNQIARGEMTEDQAQELYDGSALPGAIEKLFPRKVGPGMTSTAPEGSARPNAMFQDGRQPSPRKLARQERRANRRAERNPVPVQNDNVELPYDEALMPYAIGGLIWDQNLLKFVNGGVLPQAENGRYQPYDKYEEYSDQGNGDQIEAKFKPLWEKTTDVKLAGEKALELGHTVNDIFKRKNSFVPQDDMDAALSLDAQMNTVRGGDEGIHDQWGDDFDPGNPLAGRSGDNFTKTGRSLNTPLMGRNGGELVYAQAGLEVGDELELSPEEMMAFARLGYQIKAIR